jgi:hypothetical protein
MRTLLIYVTSTLALAAAAFAAAPGASALGTAASGGKDHASSDAPWLIGLIVLVALGLAFLLLRLRNGMGKRDSAGPFRRP